MRSREALQAGPRALLLPWLLMPLLWLACAMPGRVWAAGAEPTQAQVEAAASALAADPNLSGKEMRRELHIKPSPKKEEVKEKDKPKVKPSKSHDSDNNLAGSFAEVGRIFIWVLAGVAVIFLLLGVRRWIQAGALTREAKLGDLPSHVRDLDIRPDSLPERVGDAAWAAWQRGDQRAALSLLYRATLSRLVHVHAVPILSASTEGECVQLARPLLQTRTLDYVEQIVKAWQMAVYGARTPDALAIQGLCQGFDAELPGPALLVQGELR